jgi:hypothetical protein
MVDSYGSSGLFDARSTSMAPVTCTACGCRLQPIGPSDAAAFFHFGSFAGRDARGCSVDCAESAHDIAGRAFPTAALG